MQRKYGKSIPTRDSSTLLSHRFCLLIDIAIEEDLEEYIVELCILRDYLKELKDSPAYLDVFCTPKVKEEIVTRYNLQDATIGMGDYDLQNSSNSIAHSIDADLIFTEDIKSGDATVFEQENRLISRNIEEVKSELEIFVRGHDVPWSFDDPVWNLPWDSFYSACDKQGKEAHSLFNKFYFDSTLEEKTRETIRSLLLNRFANISYCRDKLLFFVQQQRFTKRHGYENQFYKFECSFYLSSYYFFLWGGLEQISYILDKILHLNYGWRGRNIANKRFRDTVRTKNKTLGNFLFQDELLKWFKQLRTNRHHVAHQGNITLSDLMEVPEVEMSDSELEQAVDLHPSWLFVKYYLPENTQQSFRSMIKQQILISSYKKESDSIMVIQDGKKQVIFSPLVNVQWDFNNFKLVTFGIFEHISKEVLSN